MKKLENQELYNLAWKHRSDLSSYEVQKADDMLLFYNARSQILAEYSLAGDELDTVFLGNNEEEAFSNFRSKPKT